MWVGLGYWGLLVFHPDPANSARNILDINLPYEESADKKKKRKRRKHRKVKGNFYLSFNFSLLRAHHAQNVYKVVFDDYSYKFVSKFEMNGTLK